MSDIDFDALTAYAKLFTGLTPEYEEILAEIGPDILPRLGPVTDSFYDTLQQIEKAQPFLDGRLEKLKQTHHRWLETLFSGTYDGEYAARMYHVGAVHVKVGLPTEFMAGGITMLGNDLLPHFAELCGTDHEKCVKAISAVNAVLGFTLMIMQESYQVSSVASELDKFLAITGMSRTLFENLAKAYKH